MNNCKCTGPVQGLYIGINFFCTNFFENFLIRSAKPKISSCVPNKDRTKLTYVFKNLLFRRQNEISDDHIVFVWSSKSWHSIFFTWHSVWPAHCVIKCTSKSPESQSHEVDVRPCSLSDSNWFNSIRRA